MLICMGSSFCCIQWCIELKHEVMKLLALLRTYQILDLVGITT